MIGGEETNKRSELHYREVYKIVLPIEEHWCHDGWSAPGVLHKFQTAHWWSSHNLPTWGPAGTRPKRGSEYSWRSLEIFLDFTALIPKKFPLCSAYTRFRHGVLSFSRLSLRSYCAYSCRSIVIA